MRREENKRLKQVGDERLVDSKYLWLRHPGRSSKEPWRERLQSEKKHDKKKEPQASKTDPEAHFMWTSDGGVAPSYNVQVTADAEQGLTADIEVIRDPQDA